MKSLKSMLIIVSVTFGFAAQTTAQSQTNANGLYLTFNDYVNHKLSYPISDKGDKIVTNEFLDGSTIKVISNGKKQVLSKNELIGYRLDNHDYRFQDNKAYEIIDT